jgi:small subunit ribosomal protein S6
LAQNVYEGMFLLDSNRYAKNPGGVSEKILELIQSCGGELLASRLWNEQKLAFSVKGHRKGTYWLTYFRMESSKLTDLDRQSQLNENVLRSLVLKIDPRLVDTLVEHARAGDRVEAVEDATPADSEVVQKDDEKLEKDDGKLEKDDGKLEKDDGKLENTTPLP